MSAGADNDRWQRLRRWAGPVALALLVAAGLGIAAWLPLDTRELIELGERLAGHPATLVVAAVGMALLFVFALPGSLGFWLIAPFQPWLVAVPVLVAASLAGGLGAYRLADRLGGIRPASPSGRRVRRLLARRSDFLMLCALRIFPGFPHSVINFAAGVLRLPLPRFVASTVIGLGVKFGVYAAAVQTGMQAWREGEALSPLAFWPLLAIAGLLLGGVWLRQRLDRSGSS